MYVCMYVYSFVYDCIRLMYVDRILIELLYLFCRGPFVSAIGKTWHPEHFACNSCKVSLQSQGFVEEQDKLFCEQCYNNFFAPKCASCDKPIIGVSSFKFIFTSFSCVSLLLQSFTGPANHVHLQILFFSLYFGLL